MRSLVEPTEVERDHVGPAFDRLLQPREHGLDAGLVGDTGRVLVECRRANAFDRRFGSRPEVAGRDHPLRFRRHPDRLTAVPRAVRHGARIGVDVGVFPRRVVEAVVDDPVPLRIESSDERVVVGEGERGEHRHHRFGPRPAAGKAAQVREVETVDIFRFEAVERDQDQVRLVALLGCVDPAAAGERSAPGCRRCSRLLTRRGASCERRNSRNATNWLHGNKGWRREVLTD